MLNGMNDYDKYHASYSDYLRSMPSVILDLSIYLFGSLKLLIENIIASICLIPGIIFLPIYFPLVALITMHRTRKRILKEYPELKNS